MREKESEISILLDKSQFGLTSEEIAKKTRINDASAVKFLDSLAAEKRVKKTKAGHSIFYRSAKIAILIAVATIFMISTASAQNMSSTSFNINPVLASAGGEPQGTTLKMSGKVGQPTAGVESTSISFTVCAGFICNFIEAVLESQVTFFLEFNISGSGGDAAYVDNETASNKQYRAAMIQNYFSCIHDVSLSQSPAFGIIFAGKKLNYINLTTGNSFALRVSQDIPGNEFIVPITQNNCTVIYSKLGEINKVGTLLSPFVAFTEAINAVELALGYPNIDIAGDFDRTGSFTIVIEKNDTDENQIIVKPA
ncbi:MAG: hypothetical protein HY517_02845 [Candidatus Aenigmarchaeota archaeon]|nr:hypothetical protein [Candidatus Aenigmarchaeota archaeon]